MFKNLKLTSAMQFVLHSALSILIGAFTAGLTVVAQNAFSHGTNIQTALAMGISAFSAWFIHGFVSLAGSSQLGQAEADAMGELKSTIADLVSSHQTLISFLTGGSSTSSNTPQPAPVPSQPVAQMPFPTQTATPSPIPYMPSTTFPQMPAMPQPPKG